MRRELYRKVVLDRNKRLSAKIDKTVSVAFRLSEGAASIQKNYWPSKFLNLCIKLLSTKLSSGIPSDYKVGFSLKGHLQLCEPRLFLHHVDPQRKLLRLLMCPGFCPIRYQAWAVELHYSIFEVAILWCNRHQSAASLLWAPKTTFARLAWLVTLMLELRVVTYSSLLIHLKVMWRTSFCRFAIQSFDIGWQTAKDWKLGTEDKFRITGASGSFFTFISVDAIGDPGLISMW